MAGLHEPKRLCLDSQEELGAEDNAGGVEGDVEARDAGVCCRQVVVVRRSHRDAGHGLEAFLTGGQRRTGHPEVHLHRGHGQTGSLSNRGIMREGNVRHRGA